MATVRTALGDVASRVTTEGVKCAMPRCSTSMDLALVRKLAAVSARVLPHPAHRRSAEHLIATKAPALHSYGLDSSLSLRVLQNFDRSAQHAG